MRPPFGRIFVGAMLLLALYATAATATTAPETSSCKATCTRPSCPGGCEVSAPAGCGSICNGSGCQARCRSFGPVECREEVVELCPEEAWRGPGGGQTDKSTQWAVIEYVTDQQKTVRSSDLDLLSSSDLDYGTAALFEHLDRLNAEISNRTSNEPVAAHPRRVLVVSPGGRCADIDASLNRTDWSSDQPAAAYVTGSTDGTGRIVGLEVLYSRHPDDVEALLAHVQQNLSVWSATNSSAPISFYGVVMATRHDVGYILAGAVEID